MKSESVAKYFQTLTEQRCHFMPKIQSLSQEKLWDRKKDGKRSVGEHVYHLYLIL